MKIINRNYTREYQELEKFEAGISLTGGEVKVVKGGGIKLEGSFVKITDSGAQLMNAQIPAYQYAKKEDYDPKRSRKLLLHREELERLKGKIASSPGLTIIPVSCYNKGALIKLEIALAKGRKDIEKRKIEKKKEIEKSQKREAKEYLKS